MAENKTTCTTQHNTTLLQYIKTTVKVLGQKKAVLLFKHILRSELIDDIQQWRWLVPSSAWEKLLKLPAICFLS